MILTDPRQHDNPVVFANKAFLDLTGYEEKEVLGRNCRFLQGPRTDQEHVRELREAINRGQAVSLEILNYKRNGTPFWNAVFIGPVHDTNGQLLYFFASQLDVTRRRESEDARRHSQKMEAIGQLTAGLAHDFNNLLQVVAGNHELLELDLVEPKARRRLEIAQQATERAARLTKQLLAFARKTRLNPSRLDLSKTISTFADLLETTLGSQIDLRLDLLRRMPEAMIDESQLETALLNILANSRDALGRGGTVTISTSTRHLNGDSAALGLPPGDYCMLEVRDDGAGMSEAVRARAIEPFYTTKSVGKGTGLGLAMVDGFVQQSRGRMEIDSVEGEGTTVRLLFPVAGPEEAGVGDNRRLEAPLAHLDKGSGTILLVEDNDEVRRLAHDHLVEAGYVVHVASSGDDALDRLDQLNWEIDLLFTDLIMPGQTNGLALAELVRSRAPGVRILLATGYTEDLVGEAKANGADVLGKPYRKSELLSRVGVAIARNNEEPRRVASEFGAAEA
ncbi:PAS domain-containing protein [Sphingomonas sp. KRR8]|uniref:PAS domain-containing protein n=1 Tax=Sphingomonas sp. KRR8 TaxID=2942996 RepID=UPI0020217547|nr:PAS domain-containing protein [Sphingomonas sp. KRR8]URD60029.1 PAS domain-containing protein [Sphingomonas sp. KRR8]